MTHDLTPTSFADFARAARGGSVVPVVRTIPADLQTPVGAFLRLRQAARYAFLLESVQGNTGVARYTFLGTEPHMIVRGRGRDTFVESADGEITEHANTPVTDYLRQHFRAHPLAAREGLPPLAGGCIGYLAYDAAPLFEPTLEAHESASDAKQLADDAVLMFFRTILAFDHVRQQIEITESVFTDEARQNESNLRALYDEATERTARIADLLDAPLHGHVNRREVTHEQTSERASRNHVEFSSNWTRDGFERAVESVQERILSGDCYQAVLSQRLSARVSAEPFEIYRALRRTNPAPYMYFLQLGETSIVGASPEMLVRARGGELTYRPIAGTRARGRTEAEDARLAEELRHDAKEVAEHAMLVDLGRNDLGRVAEYGSIEVAKLMTIEAYAHVQHLVTELRARLRPEMDAFDALAACFPAGTVSGAPKIAAMNLIRELEPCRRGIYAGAILYADYAGNLDSCIAIRTLVMRDGEAHVQAGAGIVADSVPHLEYEETINKARALVRAVEIAASSEDVREEKRRDV